MSRKASSTAFLALCATVAFAAPRTEPIRVLVIANASQVLPQAREAFEKSYGKGLIDLTIATDDASPDQLSRADVVFTYYLRVAIQQSLAPAINQAHRRGAVILAAPPGTSSEREWNLKLDPKLCETASSYWQYGGVDNMTAFLAFVYRAAGGTHKFPVPPPVPQVSKGIYHPRSPQPFSSLSQYLDWYGRQAIVPKDAPLVGITMYSNNWKYHDLAHVDALIAGLEKRGIGAVAVFGWPIGDMDDLLAIDGKSPLRMIFAMNTTIPKPDDPMALERWGVHVINLIVTRESQAEWEKNIRGVGADRISYLLDAPERDGVAEPIMFATFEDVPGTQTKVTKAIPERLNAAISRAQRWIVLQTKPNREKRIALVYYNNPPGKGNVGASYLAVYPTMLNLLKRMQQAGYNTGSNLPGERQLIDLLENNGRNIEEWAPGELQDLADRGGIALVSMKKYRTWFARLPKRYRDATIARWGQPEDSKLMTITSRDGQKFFVIPGMRFGNVFVGPQPLRSTFAETMNTAHDPETPVPHQYVAAYMWWRNEFKADAITHIGRHGTLEWLPGKQVGQAGWDSSEVLLGDVPDPYYYIMDGGGEAIQAKRRSAAVLIGHLTPMIVEGGKLAEFQKLDDALENLEKTDGQSADLAKEYKATAVSEIKRLKLDAQLGFDIAKLEWPEIESRVHKFLHDTENNTVPLGIHTAGVLPPENVLREGLASFIKYNFDENEWKQFGADLLTWANAVFDGGKPEVSSKYPVVLRDKIETTLAESALWIQHVRESPQRELDALITVLSGRYLPSTSLGDPLRVPMGLPTGRNLHGMDTALIPTKAAWEVGEKMADEFLARYRKQHNAYPEKISQVLWYGETNRHQGALESMAFYLLGVEPKWNGRGIVDSFRLIPENELGRPRVDVIFTISGIYRDGMADKVLMLDKAVRLAAAAGDNAISRHDHEIAAALKKDGTDAPLAEQIAHARVFGTKPGNYGVGVSKIVETSKDADGHTDDVGNLYIHYMNYAFSSEVWGGNAPTGLTNHLKGNQAVVFSRSTNVYGALDNDDTYQYFGGLNVATKTVNRAAPDMYIENLRKPGAESIVDLKTWLATELNSRDWNPKWLKEMERSGYAGARAMFKEMEHLYGFQATSAEQMDGTFWQNSYDVLVKDKYGLNMQEFFEKNNPHAQQWILSRMIEVDRQGSYKFSEEDRANLVRKYVQSVNRNGVTCSANTCGNLKVHQYIAGQAALISGLGQMDLQQFGKTLAHATQWNAKDFRNAPAAVRAGVSAAAPPRAAATQLRPAPAARPGPPVVSGYRMEQQVIRPLGQAPQAPAGATPLAGVISIIMLGAGLEYFRKRGFGSLRS